MCASALPGRAAVLVYFSMGTTATDVTYDGTNTQPDFFPTTVDANVSATGMMLPPGTTVIMQASVAATAPPSAPYLRLDQNGNSTSEAQAVANDKYFTFSITPNPGRIMSLTSLDFNATRGGGATPRGYGVRSSANGFASDLSTADLDTARPTWTPISVDLSGPGFQNLTSATTLTFRFYSYAPSPGQSIDWDDFTLNGTVTVVPEPASGLLCAAALATAARRRRTR